MKVVISARNFVFEGCGAVELLKNNGFEVIDITDGTGDYSDSVRDADAVINAFEPMSRETLEKCKNLKLISIRGVGYDYIDSSACKDLGISITRTVGAVGNAVSEQVMAYILHFARQINTMNAYMQSGEWKRIMADGASGKTLGIIGFGEIGQALAEKAKAFGMRILYNCITPKEDTAYAYATKEEIYADSDYIVLALPLTDETRHIIDKNAFSKMKRNAVLINVARAGIVDEAALISAVKSGKIRGAAVDVFESEPCTDSALCGIKNIILTPHTAPFTKNNFIDMNMLSAKNVIDFFNGNIDKKYLADLK